MSGFFGGAGAQATTGSWAGNFTGLLGGPVTATVHYVIFAGLVTLYLTDNVLDTGDGSSQLALTNLVAAVTPSDDRAASCVLVNANNDVPGLALVFSAFGTIQFGALILQAVPPVDPTDLRLELAGFNTGTIGLRRGWSVMYPA